MLRRYRVNIAVALAASALTLGVLEIGARVFSDPTDGHAALVAERAQARAMSAHVASDDPELVYVDRPNYVVNGIRITESHGIVRASDASEAKPPRTLRIAVLGDSIAAAHPIRVGGGKPFADLVEDRLDADIGAGAPHVQVLNF